MLKFVRVLEAIGVAFAIAALASGCGRRWFDPLEQDVDGGPDGPISDAGPAATCVDGDTTLLVTSALDENDPEEVAAPPHLGDGLSLREAIELANAREGRTCIRFAEPMTIQLATQLPGLASSAGMEIDGGGEVHLEGVASDPIVSAGLDLIAGAHAIRGLRISGMGVGVQAKTDGNALGPNLHTHDCDIGVRLAGDRNTVRGLLSHHNRNHGVQIAEGTSENEIAQATLHHNAVAGIQGRGTTAVEVRHVTAADNDVGLDFAGASMATTGLVVENSIFANHAGAGVAVSSAAAVASIDYCAFVDDPCMNCSEGAHSITADPKFIEPASGDYRLGPDSPAIDVGIDTGLDVNGSAPGLFNGTGPDLGGREWSP